MYLTPYNLTIMKKILIFCAIAFALASCKATRPVVQLNRENSPNLNEVVMSLQNQYIAAREILSKEGIDDKMLKITEAAITLKVTKSLEGTGELKILVIKPSGSYARTASSSVTYTLSEQDEKLGGAVGSDNTIRDMIVYAARNFYRLKGTVGKLTKKSFELDILFSVEKKGGVGLEFEVWGAEASAGVEKTHGVENELKLTFEYTDAAKK